MGERSEAMSTAIYDPWEVEAKPEGTGGSYECCPADNYPGAIVGLFDVGTHAETFNGETKDSHKVIFVYELSETQANGKPFILAEKYTLSLNSKAKMKKVLEALHGRTIAEGEKISLRQLAGMACMVNVGNTETVKDGKPRKYHNILGISKLPKGMPPFKPTLEPVLWSVKQDEPFPISLDWLPLIYGQTIEDIAKNSKEAKAKRIQVIEAGQDIPF
jgi:hypothetical protein